MRPSPDELQEDVPRRSLRKRKSGKIYDEDELFGVDEPTPHYHPSTPKQDGRKKKKVVVHKIFPQEIKQSCLQLVKELMQHEHSYPFNKPVDPVALGIPDYFDKIKEPMDFSTVIKKIEASVYQESEEFARDMRLVFQNCRSYNLDGSDIVNMCNILANIFEKDFREIKVREAKIVDNHEISEMKSIVEELRAEHQKLLAELQKLRKDGYFPSGSPQSQMNSKGKVPKKNGKKSAKNGTIMPAIIGMNSLSPEPFDLKQKELLSVKINSLSPDNLQKMVQLMAADIHQNSGTVHNGELEIDLEQLSDRTLRKLDEFVNNCLKQQTQSSSTSQNQEDSKPAISTTSTSSNSVMQDTQPTHSAINGQSNGLTQLQPNGIKEDESDSDSSSSSSSESEDANAL